MEIYRWAHLVRPLTCNRRHRFCPALLGLGGIGEGKLWEALHSFMPLVHGKVVAIDSAGGLEWLRLVMVVLGLTGQHGCGHER